MTVPVFLQKHPLKVIPGLLVITDAEDEAAVVLDLSLQLHLDVQQFLVVLHLALHLGANLRQVSLQLKQDLVDAGYLIVVAPLCVRQGFLQRAYLGEGGEIRRLEGKGEEQREGDGKGREKR